MFSLFCSSLCPSERMRKWSFQERPVQQSQRQTVRSFHEVYLELKISMILVPLYDKNYLLTTHSVPGAALVVTVSKHVLAAEVIAV